MLRNKNLSKNGFSIVEIIVVAPIVILVIGAFITTIVYMTGDAVASKAANNLAYNVQDALDRIEQDAALSSTFLATNNIATSPNQGYNNVSSDFHNVNSDSGVGSILIMNSYATTTNPMSPDRNLVFLKGKPNECDSQQLNENTPLITNVIYFVKDDTLWRRVVLPSNYNDTTNYVCNAPWQKPTCAVGYVANLCTAEDTKLIEGIEASNYKIEYFTLADQTTKDSTADDTSKSDYDRQVALNTTPIASIEISVTISAAGREYTHVGKVRVSSQGDTSLVGPSAPTSVTATGGSNQIVLNWAAPSSSGLSSITNYNIYQGDAAGNETFLIQVGNVLTYTDSGLGASTTKYYRISAVNSQQPGELSDSANATTNS